MKTLMLLCLFPTLLLADTPATPSKPATPKPIDPPPIVRREEWGSEPQPIPDSRKQTPKFVTLHHAGVIYKPTTDPAKFVKNMQGWGQRDKGWPDLAYHFLIAPDGRIFEARLMQYEPESNTKYPLQGHVGVEMMGDFSKQRINPKQLEAAVKLVAWICQEQKIDPSQIAGHKDRAVGQTECPGKDFYRYLEDGQFIKWVRATMAGENPKIDPGPPLEGGPTVPVEAPAPQAVEKPAPKPE
jgi:hypothetical protein